MLDSLVMRVPPRFAAAIVPGALLHRRALVAAAAGRYAEAERLFEAAGLRYRRELEIEALARLRVHQLMVAARAERSPGREAERMLDIVRRLNRLDRLESLAAPYELDDARAVLSAWIGDGSAAGRVRRAA